MAQPLPAFIIERTRALFARSWLSAGIRWELTRGVFADQWPPCSCYLYEQRERSDETRTRHDRDRQSRTDAHLLSGGAADRTSDLSWQLCRICPGGRYTRPVAPIRVCGLRARSHARRGESQRPD